MLKPRFENGLRLAALALTVVLINACAGQDGKTGKQGVAGAQVDGSDGADGKDGADGSDGAEGVKGNTGTTGINGQACWDLNNNGTADLATEDKNLDGAVNVLDCQAAAGSLKGKVLSAAGQPIAGAKVYAVPADAINATPITATTVLNGTAAAHDEPLEDTVLENPAGLLTVTAAADGSYEITGFVAAVSYFVYADPGTTSGFLPGGSGARISALGSALVGKASDIILSAGVAADATYVGSTRCLQCHSSKESQKYTAHRLGIQKTGVLSKWQENSDFPNMNSGIDKFTLANDWDDAGVQKVLFAGADATRKFDKYKAYDNVYAGANTCAEAYLWKNLAGDYKVTIVNTINPADAGSPMTVDAKLTYGGAVYKQRLLVEVPGKRGLYPFIQYQGYTGIDANIASDRTRGTYRDYHLDWFVSKGVDGLMCTSDDKLGIQAAAKNFEGSCLSCHATGWKQVTEPTTGVIFGTSVADVNGEYDIDGDGKLNELNTGCEVCHGPGSKHDVSVKGIVSPARLTTARSVQLCNRCHDRVEGKLTKMLDKGNTIPINDAGEPPLPGMSRAETLAGYTSRKGPDITDFYKDAIHSKSHHQQGPDLLKSKHYRNGQALLDCTSCHNVHGTEVGRPKHMLRDDGDALCQGCHVDKVITAHQLSKNLGFFGAQVAMPGATCTSCHMPMTARTGAGKKGALIGADQYWEGDLGSHVFLVPRKDHPGSKGVAPSAAMPVPYTNSCGNGCHSVSPSGL